MIMSSKFFIFELEMWYYSIHVAEEFSPLALHDLVAQEVDVILHKVDEPLEHPVGWLQEPDAFQILKVLVVLPALREHSLHQFGYENIPE